MKTNETITKYLELYFDWRVFKELDIVLVSDDEMDYHMLMIYDTDGDLLHGFHIERIK